jgi:hypothetical protein
MKTKTVQCGQWKFRDDELSMPEYRKLNPTERQEYLDLIKGLPIDERSSIDEYLINLYNLNNESTKNFFEL